MIKSCKNRQMWIRWQSLNPGVFSLQRVSTRDDFESDNYRILEFRNLPML